MPDKPGRANALSPDLTAPRVEKLRELVPEAFVEGRVDCDRLREALGDAPERYSFIWACGRRPCSCVGRRRWTTPRRGTCSCSAGCGWFEGADHEVRGSSHRTGKTVATDNRAAGPVEKEREGWTPPSTLTGCRGS